MTSSIVFKLLLAHLPVLLTVGWILRRWHFRLQQPLSPFRWLLALTTDAAYLFTALVLGVAVLGVTGQFGFLTMRFGAQVLFGETVLLLAGMTLLHFSCRTANGHHLRWHGVFLGLLTVALLSVYAEAYHHCPYDLQVRRHHLDLTRGTAGNGTLRILHLSDLQTHAIRAYERRVFTRAAALKPDLIVFTGDYLQSRSRPNLREGGDDFRALIREAGFQPRYGFFATQGDCENEAWEALFAGLDVTCLSNESRVIPLSHNKSLVLTGLDRKTSRFAKAPVVQKVVLGAPTGDHHLVIGHAPDFVAHLEHPSGIDLALAGHTHGGQIVIPGFGPPVTFSKLPRRYAGGLTRFRNTPLHVSRGIGMERGLAPQFRFLCPPEICLIELRY